MRGAGKDRLDITGLVDKLCIGAYLLLAIYAFFIH